ncbi:3628_t:CDS:1, partial [Cetraspora pellucida]
AQFEDRHHHFGGIDDIDTWLIKCDLAQHQQDAKQWRKCFTKSGRKQYKKLTHVWWP